MGAAIGITPTEYTGLQLRTLASQCEDGAQVRRLLAFALVLEGCSRGEAAALHGMDPPDPARLDVALQRRTGREVEVA